MDITKINYTILSDYCLLDGGIMYSYRWNPKFHVLSKDAMLYFGLALCLYHSRFLHPIQLNDKHNIKMLKSKVKNRIHASVGV